MHHHHHHHGHPHAVPAPHVKNDEKVVALMSLANNKYITVHHDSHLLASKEHVHNEAEKFELIRLHGNRIALRSLYTNRYVCAEEAGASSLVANREQPGIWEEFELIQLGEGKIALRACINGNFICAEDYGRLPLIGNRKAVGGAWEEFYMFDLVSKYHASKIVTFFSLSNNHYVSVMQHHQHHKLIAHSPHVHQTERFEVIPLTGSKVAIRSVANHKYVCAEDAGRQALNATRDSHGVWEEFEIYVLNESGHVALKACINGHFVCADDAGRQALVANRDAPKGLWEVFIMNSS